MRFAGVLAIALWLSFPVAGMVPGPQQPTDPSSAGQSPQDAPAPAKTTPTAGRQAPQGAAKEKAKEKAKKKTDAGAAVAGSGGSASVAPKHRKRTTPAPDSGPRRIVVREGGASEPAAQIVPGMPPAEATRQRQNAEHLLVSTGDQLKQLAGRTLGAQQQETVGQIRNYMEGARSALKEGDVQRASTLAEKAHLLADDLAKH